MVTAGGSGAQWTVLNNPGPGVLLMSVLPTGAIRQEISHFESSWARHVKQAEAAATKKALPRNWVPQMDPTTMRSVAVPRRLLTKERCSRSPSSLPSPSPGLLLILLPLSLLRIPEPSRRACPSFEGCVSPSRHWQAIVPQRQDRGGSHAAPKPPRGQAAPPRPEGCGREGGAATGGPPEVLCTWRAGGVSSGAEAHLRKDPLGPGGGPVTLPSEGVQLPSVRDKPKRPST